MLMKVSSDDNIANRKGGWLEENNVLELSTFLTIVRRRAKLIWVTIGIAIALALIFVATTRPLYTATATVLIDSRNAKVFDQNQPISLLDLGLDTSNIDSQVEILKSEKVALTVIKSLNIADLPEFNEPNNIVVGAIKAVSKGVKSLLSLSPEAPLLEDGVPRDVVEDFVDRLEVKRVNQTYVLTLSFRSRDPEMAARITNEIANAYLNEGLNAKYDSVKRASAWLQDRLQELRREALASDQAVQKFKAEHDLFAVSGSNGQLLSEAQMAEVSERLSAARNEVVEKTAKSDRIRQIIESGQTDATIVDALNSEVINKLRDQYTQASAREADITRRLGSDHLAAVKLRDEMKEMKRLMLSELGRFDEIAKSEVDIARKKVIDLEATLARAKVGATVTNKDQVQLRELERDAETYRNLYASFLDRYKTAMQMESFPVTEARVLSAATPPRLKSHPKTVLVLLLAGIGGITLGIGLALLRELVDRVFRTPNQIQSVFGAPCLGVLPILAAGRAGATQQALAPKPGVVNTLAAGLGIYRYSVTEPMSRFAETIRAMRVAIDFPPVGLKVQVLGIVSSVPGEGKSTTASNLAQHLASAGKKVLLVDGDLRNPSLSKSLTANRTKGLLNMIIDGDELATTIYVDPVTNLYFLPADGGRQILQSIEVVASQRMSELVSELRGRFDYVIIDLPPIAPVVDVKAMAGLVDAFLYVVEWGKTTFSTAEHALNSVPDVSTKLLGVVLNKTNLKALSLYTSDGSDGYYNYGSFSDYAHVD